MNENVHAQDLGGVAKREDWEALSTEDACAILGNIGKTKLYEMLKQNKLRRLKCGRRTLILVGDVKALLAHLAQSAA